jgi:hypothetical protein
MILNKHASGHTTRAPTRPPSATRVPLSVRVCVCARPRDAPPRSHERRRRRRRRPPTMGLIVVAQAPASGERPLKGASPGTVPRPDRRTISCEGVKGAGFGLSSFIPRVARYRRGSALRVTLRETPPNLFARAG